MKKQIGLLAITALFVLFVAFSGVASAQASNVQVLFFESPMCSVCQQVKPLVESAAAQTGAKLIVYDVSQSPGSGIAKANGISGTPTIVIQGGQTLVGAVTEQQIVAAIQAAAGPTTPKAVATPTPVPVVKATATPKTVAQPTATKPTTPYIGNKATKVVHLATCWHVKEMAVKNMVGFNTLAQAEAQGYRPCKDCLGATATKTVVKTVAQPAIQVVTATQTPTASTQTVPEFSLLGLGAPALVVGAIYLFLRKR